MFGAFAWATVLIPLEQGGVFRREMKLIATVKGFNPFGTGRGLSTFDMDVVYVGSTMSQSLWNRAGSFDADEHLQAVDKFVSIPLKQGGVFRTSLQF